MMAVGFSVYVRRYLIDPEALRAALKCPVLLWEAGASEPRPDQEWMGTETGSARQRPRAGDPVVFEVKKGVEKSNPFTLGITVGRIDSNDLVVEDPSVSRFHAYFRLEKTGEWWLVDADSRNGTSVAGQKLPKTGRAQVTTGTKVRFGEVEMIFLDADALLARCKAAMS